MVKPYAPDIEVPDTGDPGTGTPSTQKPPTSDPEPVEYHGTTIDDVLDRPTVSYSPRTFELRVQFNMAIADRNATPELTKSRHQETVHDWIDLAERLFLREPALKIEPIWNWDVPWTGKLATNDLVFESVRERERWLDQEFDNIVGSDKTDGAMQVLFVDSLVAPTASVTASSFFPHSLNVFSRKHGIVSEFVPKGKTIVRPGSQPRYEFEGVLAHELGHAFGLKHTFDTYWGLTQNCNKDYDNEKGSTRLDDDRINLMDYWDRSVTDFYLNHCQQSRAADQRERYLTSDGEVNYRKLKGGR